MTRIAYARTRVSKLRPITDFTILRTRQFGSNVPCSGLRVNELADR